MAERGSLIVIFVFMLLIPTGFAYVVYQNISTEGVIEGGPSTTWELGGFGYTQIPVDDDDARAVITVEVESTYRFDVYLFEERPDSIWNLQHGPDAIREGLVGDGRSVEWSVDMDEYGTEGLWVVLDNTDHGEVPVAPGGTIYTETIRIDYYRSLWEMPEFWVLVLLMVLATVVGLFLLHIARTETDEFAETADHPG